MFNTLGIRVVTSVVGASALLTILLLLPTSGLWWFIFALVTFVWLEWMCCLDQSSPEWSIRRLLGTSLHGVFVRLGVWMIGSGFLFVLFTGVQIVHLYFLVMAWVCCIFVGLCIVRQWMLPSHKDSAFYINQLLFWTAGLVYVSLLFWPVMQMIAMPQLGSILLIKLLVTIWIGDTSAYFVGVRFGKAQCSQLLSPRKTWMGVGASIWGATLVFLALFWEQQPWWILVGMGGLLASLAVLGDLLGSAIKRKLRLKDFGSILPGHGGLLDRVDGLLFSGAVYFAWIYLEMIH